MTTPNGSEDVEQQELLFIAGGITVLENTLAISYKTKHVSWHLPKRAENVCLPKKNKNKNKNYA